MVACPTYAATCNGWLPSWPSETSEAPAASRMATMLSCPQKAATCSGVDFSSSKQFTVLCVMIAVSGIYSNLIWILILYMNSSNIAI